MTGLSEPDILLSFEKAMGMRQAELFGQECIRRHQGQLVFGKITPDDLMDLYKKWW